MVTHKKTKQKLTKIDRSKRKPKKSAAAAHGIDTDGMPAKDAKAVEKAAESLPKPPRQTMIPGTEPKHYAELGGLAEELADAKDRVKTAVNLRKTREAALITGMRKRGVTHYVDRGLNIEITLESPDRVKVKKYDHNDVDEDKLA